MKQFDEYLSRIETKISRKTYERKERANRNVLHYDLKNVEDYREIKESIQDLQENVSVPIQCNLATVKIPVEIEQRK